MSTSRGSGVGVLAVMDGYRVTGPARQLLASAVSSREGNTPIRVAIFQRPAAPTPMIRAARGMDIPTFVVPDRFPGDPRTAFALAGLTTQPGTGILQTHGYKANVLAALIAPRVRRPWIAFLHGETRENWKVRAYFACERVAIRRADRIVVVCHQMARMLAGLGIPGSKIRVVHNACLVEPSLGDDAPSWSPDAPPIVGVVGRLSPEKGVDIALRVQQSVLRSCRGARLWIVGEGPEQERLKRDAEELGIASSVEWLGFQQDLGRLYPEMAVLLIPSRSEGLPNVALEAMAYGIPVVATAVGGVPEVVADRRTGFLVPPGDVEGLASRALQLLENAPLRRRFGCQGREAARSRFSSEARWRTLVSLYHEMIG